MCADNFHHKQHLVRIQAARKCTIEGEDHRYHLSDALVLQVRISPEPGVQCFSGIKYVSLYGTGQASGIGPHDLIRGLMLL